jgi:hypothetical protein
LLERHELPVWGPWSVKEGVIYASQTAAVDCLVAAGGVVAMRPLIVHASSKIADRERLRYNVETDLKWNRIGQAVDVLASHPRRDFPLQSTPPPWEYGEGDKTRVLPIGTALK